MKKHPFITLLLLALFHVFPIESAEFYTVHILSKNTSHAAIPTDLNRNGQVCGYLYHLHSNQAEVFLWDKDTGLQTTRKQSVTPPILNDSGQVYGTESIKGWIWNSLKGFMWSPGGKTTSIQNPEWSDTIILATNGRGDLLLSDQKPLLPWNLIADYVLFNAGVIQEIDLNQSSQIPYKVNDNRVLLTVELLGLDNQNNQRVALMDADGQELNQLQIGDFVKVTDWNDLGQVVGETSTHTNDTRTGFLWDTTTGEIQLFDHFLPSSINNLGQMIGEDHEGNPILYENGEPKDLHRISFWSSEDEAGSFSWSKPIKLLKINDSGSIIGWAIVENKIEGFLLEPSDQPGAPVEWGTVDAPIEFSDSLFSELTAQGAVLVNIYHPQCGHCVKMHPILERVAKSFKGEILIAKGNYEHNKKTAGKLKIQAFPTFILYKDGKEVKRFAGYRSYPEMVKILQEK